MEPAKESTSASDEHRKIRVNKFKQDHEFKRFSLFDKNRFFESETVTEKDINGLCSRIKRRKHATAEDMRTLANAFLQDEANITAFLKVTGAINVIIKEFTGNDRARQLLAAQCLCNLSLGDETSCSKLVTFAGSYLMIFIMNPIDVSLCKICLWTTQNIVATGGKAIDILLSQELLKNCLHIIANSVEHSSDAMQLLDLIVLSKWEEISEKSDVEQAVLKVLAKKPEDVMTLQVLYRILIPRNISSDFDSEIVTKIIKIMTSNLKSADEQVVYFSTRIITHLTKLDPRFRDIFLEFHSIKLSEMINTSTQVPKLFFLFNELMYLHALLIQHSPQYLAFDPIENLKVPQIFKC